MKKIILLTVSGISLLLFGIYILFQKMKKKNKIILISTFFVFVVVYVLTVCGIFNITEDIQNTTNKMIDNIENTLGDKEKPEENENLNKISCEKVFGESVYFEGKRVFTEGVFIEKDSKNVGNECLELLQIKASQED